MRDASVKGCYQGDMFLGAQSQLQVGSLVPYQQQEDCAGPVAWVLAVVPVLRLRASSLLVGRPVCLQLRGVVVAPKVRRHVPRRSMYLAPSCRGPGTLGLVSSVGAARALSPVLRSCVFCPCERIAASVFNAVIWGRPARLPHSRRSAAPVITRRPLGSITSTSEGRHA
ncbi:hypothetical protein FOA52_007241 [Chlamydomonas sp. UWO 241]|nr:hypothetical protein FOA52_007241 [Chlamydomonas sp. UWO 241]